MKNPVALVLLAALIAAPAWADAGQEPRQPVNAQQTSNVPPEARQAEDAIEDAVRRFGVGVVGGVGLDPELIMFGAHGTFEPVFHPAVRFRPGLEVGAGEVTTLLAINLDVLYTLPGATRGTAWSPYIGAGPTFGLSHKGFETGDADNVETDDPADTPNRFDFSDTDFNGGMNFIAGARNRDGLFFELRATAWGVSNIRLLAGFNF
ncbi:MAG TPA: hypothetical protein VFK57_13215 [Vicinamibacterales bacterium]|nr:hypothetical protein [Vicinamibacterales bacterium]